MAAAAATARKRFRSKPTTLLVHLFCEWCGKQYDLPAKTYRLRAKHTKSGKLFCCKSCGARHRRKDRPPKPVHGPNHSAFLKFKRRQEWSEEQWRWERLLVSLGLGMGRGLSRLIQYGWEDEVDRNWNLNHK